MMKRSGFTKAEFAFSPRHAEYVADARDGYASIYEVVPTPVAVSPGDIVCAGRSDTELLPSAIATVRKGFELHCDIVVHVDVRSGRAEAIGGNVQQTVAKTILLLDDQGRVAFDESTARKWALVMKLRRGNSHNPAQLNTDSPHAQFSTTGWTGPAARSRT
jgi:hypothetical protein